MNEKSANGLCTIYPSNVLQISKLPEEHQRLLAYEALFRTAFTGEKVKVDDLLIDFCISTMQDQILIAGEKYKKDVTNGKKGGRPSKVNEENMQRILSMYAEGSTQAEIAEELGVNKKTVQRKLSGQVDKTGQNHKDKDINKDKDKDINKDKELGNNAANGKVIFLKQYKKPEKVDIKESGEDYSINDIDGKVDHEDINISFAEEPENYNNMSGCSDYAKGILSNIGDFWKD